MTVATTICRRNSANELEIYFHEGQARAHASAARVVLVLAGSQSGKSSYGPFWLAQEMGRKGPGDYMVVAPTLPLLSKKVLPEFLRLFGRQTLHWGTYRTQKKTFELSPYGAKQLWGRVPSDPTNVYFCHASDPDSLESATAKAAWLDEAGQKKFKLGSMEAVNRRLALHQGRILITTTPYGLGWLKTQYYDRWKAGAKDVEVINFSSLMNPSFPKEEYYDRKAKMPGWKFRMFYDGMFERPAGAVYDCFDEDRCVVPAFAVPDAWPRHLGLDFGGVHTAGVFLAEEQTTAGKPTGRFFGYREYPEKGAWGSATARDHGERLLKGEPRIPNAVGGSHSEDQWRAEFRVGGLPVREPPIKDVAAGISRVFELIKTGRLLIMDNCPGLIDDLVNYSYELTEDGQSTEKIEDKEDYHYADSLRYISAYLLGGKKKLWMH